MKKYEKIQDRDFLLSYGVVCKHGSRDNQTDCETDYVMLHLPSREEKRFNGTLYSDDYVNEVYEWVVSHELVEDDIGGTVVIPSELNPIITVRDLIEWYYLPYEGILKRGE